MAEEKHAAGGGAGSGDDAATIQRSRSATLDGDDTAAAAERKDADGPPAGARPRTYSEGSSARPPTGAGSRLTPHASFSSREPLPYDSDGSLDSHLRRQLVRDEEDRQRRIRLGLAAGPPKWHRLTQEDARMHALQVKATDGLAASGALDGCVRGLGQAYCR